MLVLLWLGNTMAAQAQTSWASGAGYPFAGVAGVRYQWQPSRQSDQQWSGAIGLVGAAVSWQLTFDDQRRHSVGLTLGQEAISADEVFLTMDYLYYPAGFAQAGWFYGLSAGNARYRKGSTLLGQPGNKPCAAGQGTQLFCQQQRQHRVIGFFSVGYQF